MTLLKLPVEGGRPVHNCFILGSGRSGTSMTAGLLNNAGYYFGSHLLRPRPANPKGFFEDKVVNATNEIILRQVLRCSRLPKWPARLLRRGPYFRGQLWVAVLDRPVDWTLTQTARRTIARLVGREPFAFKDPRFSYTLNAWRPYLRDSRFVCVFRDPRVTATSIVQEIAAVPYTRNISMRPDQALLVWQAMYRQILDFHCDDLSQWLFVEYEQLLAGTALEAIARFLDARIDRSFIDRRLNRSKPAAVNIAGEAGDLYDRLCDNARVTQAAALRL